MSHQKHPVVSHEMLMMSRAVVACLAAVKHHPHPFHQLTFDMTRILETYHWFAETLTANRAGN